MSYLCLQKLSLIKDMVLEGELPSAYKLKGWDQSLKNLHRNHERRISKAPPEFKVPLKKKKHKLERI